MLTVIIGKSASGKTTLARKMAAENPDASIYFTDDYIPHGFEKAVYIMMRDILADKKEHKIVEGVQVPRLLRHGARTGLLHADKIIICRAHVLTRRARHVQRGSTATSVKNRERFDKTVMGIFDEYLAIASRKPNIEYYNT